MQVPGAPASGDVRVWGHPATVQGFTEFDSDGVTPTLYAVDVPPATFVGMREGILADEEAEIARGETSAAASAEQEEGVRNAFLSLLFFLIPIPFAIAWGYARFGTEPGVDYDREYE